MSSSGAPCGACKFLRRKCVRGCIFAPYFGAEQGAARFAAVHKIFGASNVGKLLLHIPLGKRCDAVLTISYEAQARLSDPVYGCVATIFALQQQVASLQAELAMVQAQLASRLAVAALQQQQAHGAGGGAGGSSSMSYVETGSGGGGSSVNPAGSAGGMSIAGNSSSGVPSSISYAGRIKEESYHHGMPCYDHGHHHHGQHGIHMDAMPPSPPSDMDTQDMQQSQQSQQHKPRSRLDPQQSGTSSSAASDMGDLQILAQALLSSRK
ncbi:hypothetical protein R1sor_025642 [Riccia sorocarpa]|uniref:LOB domain-containing protein n=1 Tax=Riccia sorocarpa TaxID=122646 RepID=A0ABD3GEU8_9MARC